MPDEPDATAPLTNAHELVRSRWGVAAAYLAATALSHFQAMSVPVAPILGAALVTAVTNAVLALRAPQAAGRMGTLALLLFDTLLLSTVLALTGGASNPLSAMYIVWIALAGLLLRRPWAWVLAAISVLAYGSLFFIPADPGPHGHAHHSDPFGAHLRDMWLAFALTSALIAYFVTRLTEQLARARTRAARAERVAALASLAAGTSHQLGTPLASILLAATEMRRCLDQHCDPAQMREDVELVATQARRCRTIIDAMLAEAGQMVGEAPVETTASALLGDVLAGLPGSDRARVAVQLREPLPTLHLPARVVAQALQNLVQNAIDASPVAARVEVEALACDEDRLCFQVRDHGRGLDPESAEAAMEPFVSSKDEPGHGLGLFLARALAEQLGGQLTLRRAQGGGMVARFEIRAGARQVTSSARYGKTTT